MEQNKLLSRSWTRIILASVILGAAALRPAGAQVGTSVLLMQQTPSTGGMVTPKVGVHHFGTNENVALRATPEPGYQFLYWLGDVREPAAQATVVQLDAPKIVIAVFERSKYERLDVETRSLSAPVGGLIPTAADIAGAGSITSGAAGPRTRTSAAHVGPEPNNSPTQQTTDDDLTPVPEPATALLLVFGSVLAHITVRKNQVRRRKLYNRSWLSNLG
ncbi:MAG TPA: hypothetical protein VMX13_10690 [Sedimentisphaerales bacterium]|nr:hypothetical protein [Sedimentisphaerales bacterium]